MRCEICDYCDITKEGLLTEYSNHNKVNRVSGLCTDCSVHVVDEDGEIYRVFNESTFTTTGEVPIIETEFDEGGEDSLPKRDVSFE